MSASQQSQNKKLHKLIDQLEDQIERIKTERDEFQQASVDALGKVEDLQDEIKLLKAENAALQETVQKLRIIVEIKTDYAEHIRKMVSEAWTSGWQTGRSGLHHSEIMPEWMKQKGLE